MTEREKMIDLIINAKRTDPETESFTEYLADFLLGYGIKLPDPTPQPGNPLTLDQLREMDGQPAWIVEYPDWGHWELSEDANDYIVDRNLDFYGMKHDDPDGRYGLHKLGWLAYSYPPAHIDRSGWISVKERLPKTGTVLVTDGKIVITAPSSSVTKDGLAITHWMPLPEPPEEG